MSKGKVVGYIRVSTIEQNPDRQLEGFKGYITNAAKLPNDEIIKRYSELWQVEKAFRMSKSDLKARPIFHTL